MPEPHKLTTNSLYEHFEQYNSVAHGKALVRLLRGAAVDIGSVIRGHVLGDAWMDFSVHSLQEYFSTTAGFVYVVQTPQYPELFKVGKTARPLSERIAELNNEAVLLPFQVTQAYPVHDRHYVERMTHLRLTLAGVPRLKEFFRATPGYLDAQIKQVVHEDGLCLERQGFFDCIKISHDKFSP